MSTGEHWTAQGMKFWPLVVALVAGTFAIADTRMKVQTIEQVVVRQQTQQSEIASLRMEVELAKVKLQQIQAEQAEQTLLLREIVRPLRGASLMAEQPKPARNQ